MICIHKCGFSIAIVNLPVDSKKKWKDIDTITCASICLETELQNRCLNRSSLLSTSWFFSQYFLTPQMPPYLNLPHMKTPCWPNSMPVKWQVQSRRYLHPSLGSLLFFQRPIMTGHRNSTWFTIPRSYLELREGNCIISGPKAWVRQQVFVQHSELNPFATYCQRLNSKLQGCLVAGYHWQVVQMLGG